MMTVDARCDLEWGRMGGLMVDPAMYVRKGHGVVHQLEYAGFGTHDLASGNCESGCCAVGRGEMAIGGAVWCAVDAQGRGSCWKIVGWCGRFVYDLMAVL